MTKILFCAALALAMSVDCTAQSTTVKYEVLPSQSTLKWTGYYLFNFGEHTGTINITDGKILADDKGGISGLISADMKSIRDTDMAYEDGGKDLSEHLMSKDFFDVSQYPGSKLEIVKSEPVEAARPGDVNTKLIANLTLKQVTAPVTLYATIDRTSKSFTAVGKFKFDRTRWGIEYNSGKVFSEVGDGAISDAIAIEFNIIAEVK
ncbi:YceI family protein [Chryseolinea sp. T2]|uniref:YceI family protein n=1 Tax=Chryseolinea sp. T2 TaxID=3129255 RepID=UPI003077648B